MKTPVKADLQRWSDEVARDPRSLAFLPLARAYRRKGLREAAMKLCLRGLEAHPAHVEAHGLLALLYLEAGDTTRAADEWSMVLRIDRQNFDALRGLGFCYLAQDELSRARQVLERAALIKPSDPAVREALGVLGTRQELARDGLGRSSDPASGDDPWVTTASPHDSSPAAQAPAPTADRSSPLPGADAVAGARQVADLPRDPVRVFDDMLGGGPLLGALLVDSQGLVLAGRLTEAVAGDGAMLGAVLGGVIDEARRTSSLLALGGWDGILLEAEHAMLHLSPAGEDAILVLAAGRDAPAGWLIRAAAQAAEHAGRYMEAYE